MLSVAMWLYFIFVHYELLITISMCLPILQRLKYLIIHLYVEIVKKYKCRDNENITWFHLFVEIENKPENMNNHCFNQILQLRSKCIGK